MNFEIGGLRLQRVSPTEKRGRVHSSTITRAIVDQTNNNLEISDNEFRIEWFSGGVKAGGQHSNKHDCCVRLIHIETGITEIRRSRSRDNNLKEAKNAIIEKLKNNKIKTNRQNQQTSRKIQVGSGQRADKTATIRFQDNIAINHITNKKMPADKFMNGFMDFLHTK